MIIRTAQRLDTLKEYYFSVKLKEVKALEELGHSVINLGIGSPDLAPSSATISALSISASNPNNHGYQSYKGTSSFRKSISDWYQSTYNVVLNPELEILPLMGSKEGISHISLTFLDAGDEVLVPELGYPTYSSVTQMVGANVRYYPLVESNNFEPDWERMHAEDYKKVKLMWVNYPHMPTGAVANKGLFEKIIAFAKKNQILVCHDNPYSLVLNETAPLSILSIDGAKDVSIELNSLSKSHNMAGWRIGWIAGAREYIDQILKVKSNFDSGMFLGIQEAAIEALKNSDKWHRDRNEIYRERREIAYQILDILQCSYKKNQPGMFVWAKVPDQVANVEKFVDYILNEFHIFITPGFIFGPSGQRHIRLSLCTKRENLLQVVKRLSNFSYSSI